MNLRWSRFGGQLGVAFCVAGLVLVFLGWNGAASWDRVPSQFPYLISGGVAGLSLVVIGAALLVVQNQRADRAKLEASLGQLRDAIERLAAPGVGSSRGGAQSDPLGMVVVGQSAFHRPSCRLLEGRGLLPTMSREEAVGRGLAPCRTCAPARADGGRAPRATRARRATH